MNVIWLCNTLLPELEARAGVEKAKPESWISALYSSIRDELDQMYYLYKGHDENCFTEGNTTFISYIEKDYTRYDNELVDRFVYILKSTKPDIIHIFGTERAHTYAMTLAAKICGYSDRVVISLQGIVSKCAHHYTAFLPEEVVRGKSFRNILKKDNVACSKERFEKSGKLEIRAINNAHTVIGRTYWDEAVIKSFAPHIKYYKCNENLRDEFYSSKTWDYNLCKKHSIFITQSNYPLKGFHLAVEALKEIRQLYPDVHLYTTGLDIIHPSIKQRVKETYYQKYLRKLIMNYHLEKNISFLGALSAREMVDAYLNANVFLLASSIENSPNSLGEAMFLGVPCVASYVGGVTSQFDHGIDGFLYQSDAPYLAAHYICKLFEDVDLMNSFSENARKHAQETYNRDKNLRDMLDIYKDITENR